MNSRHLKTVFGFGMILLLLAWAWPRILPLLTQVRLDVLLKVLLLTVASYPLLITLRMDYGLKMLFGINVPFYDLLKLETISKFMYYFSIPKIYIPLKVYLLKRIGKIETSTSISYMSIESPMDNLLLLVLSLMGGLTIFKKSVYYQQFLPAMYLLTLLLVGGAVGYLLNKKWIFSLAHSVTAKLRLAFAERVLAMVERIFSSIENGIRTLLSSPKALLYFGILTAGGWLVQVAKYHIFLASFGIQLSTSSLIFALALSSLVGILSMIPGGIGAKEAAGTVAFVLLGVPSQIALLILLIDRIIAQGVIFFLGLLMLLHHDFDYRGMLDAVKSKLNNKR